MMSRMVLFITFGIYLLGVGMLLSAIQVDVPQVEFNSSGVDLPQTDYSWNLPNNIAILPLWFNIIFIIVPFIAEIIILVSLFFPTGNAGS